MSFRPLHICHLSVLNPAQHSRIFHKEAITQAAAGHSVTIIAQDPAPHPYTENGIHIIPLGQFGRIRWARWRAAAKLFQLACKTKADIFIIHTPELLDTALRLKKQFPLARFVYDMHEDYPLNIRTAAYYPWGLRHVLAAKVLQAERNFQAWGDAVVYAEACFEGHLKMKSGQAITVANKCLLPSQAPAPSFPKPGETPIQKGEFDKSLEQALNKSPSGQKELVNPTSMPNINAQGIKFSAHATQRLRERQIQFNPEMMAKMNEAITKADAKGVQDTLVLTDQAALIVSVPSRTVITAMDRNNLNGNIFTNIDGAVII